MDDQNKDINSRYEAFYAKNASVKVYPTEFVVRIFLANYPRLKFRKPNLGDQILDVGFGDGRNTAFLCDRGLDVSGIEITQGIVDQTAKRLKKFGYYPDLRVGRNTSIPFEDQAFDYVLACHCCYYCDEGEAFADNLQEYARVMKQGAFLVASVAYTDSYIFTDSTRLADGSYLIGADPYGNRNGYRLYGCSNTQEIEDYFAPFFTNFSFAFASNDYFGISEQVFWIVCQRS